MSVGPKLTVLGVFWRSSEAYQTFLVLGPIDLTNGMASVVTFAVIHAARDQQQKI
jgi:hypothetical protein